MQLNPREQFTIVRQIDDTADATTYYVRAVIRNAKTDALISVNGNNYLNLTDRGSRRFSVNWLVPADVSGQGFYVSILTTVYTDSGYTAKSATYGESIENYIFKDRFNHNLGGIGGGADIDYKKIKRLLKEVVDEMIPSETKVVTVTNTKEVIKEVKIPEIVRVESPLNLRPLYVAIEKLNKDSFGSIEKSGLEKNKMLLEAFLAIASDLKGSFKGGERGIAEIKKELSGIVKNKDIEKALNDLTFEMKPRELKVVETTGTSVDPRVSKILKK